MPDVVNDLLGSEPMSQSGISAGRAIAPDEARHLRAAGTSWFAPERGMVRGHANRCAA